MISTRWNGQPGVPLTETERAQRHYERYGTYETPPRGTGLRRLGEVDVTGKTVLLIGGVVLLLFLIGRR